MYSNYIILIILYVTNERSGNVPRRFVGNEPKENEKRTSPIPLWETNVLGTFPEGSLETNQKRTKNEPVTLWETNVLGTFPEGSLGTNQKRTKNQPVTHERPTFWERSQNVPRRFVENEPWENQKRTFVERSVLAGEAFPQINLGVTSWHSFMNELDQSVFTTDHFREMLAYQFAAAPRRFLLFNNITGFLFVCIYTPPCPFYNMTCTHDLTQVTLPLYHV